MTVIISHFHNEEYLMPYWLAHHLPMFDHGVLIDYDSTDDSVAIIRKLAPEWEVRRSRNRDFASQPVDDEVMDIEREFGGWKTAANTTEFICGDIIALTESLDAHGFDAVQLRPIVMVDPPEMYDVELDPDEALIKQRHYGFAQARHVNSQPRSLAQPFGLHYRSRLLHRHPDGAYTLGRHGTEHVNVVGYPDNVTILWFAYAPMTPEFRDRKISTHARIPASEAWRGFDPAFVYDEAQVIADWEAELPRVVDLRTLPEYAAAVQ